MPMVSYQTFTRLAFRVAEQKGAQFEGIADGGQFISDVADVWQEEKAELRQMTEQQAAARLMELVEA